MNEKHLGSNLDDFLSEEGRLDEAEALAAERIRRYQATSGYAPFDAADYLDDEETIAEYLATAQEDPNSEVLQVAVQDVLRARMKAHGNEDRSAAHEELRRRLAGYQLCDRLFREKYGMTLAEFEAAQVVKQHGYSFEVEGDHQDWDQALDGIRTIERQLAALLE